MHPVNGYLILAASLICHNKPFFLSFHFGEKWTALDKSWIKLVDKGGDRLALFG
jgi:hypothetical protein